MLCIASGTTPPQTALSTIDIPWKGRPLAGAFVFLNACAAGRAAEGLIGHGPWAETFLKAGAAAVLAPVSPVEDEAARHFAEEVYAALAEGTPIADAVQAGRRALGDAPSRLVWLLYAAHGAAWS